MTILGVPGIPRGPLGDFSGRGDATGVRPDIAFTRLGVPGVPRGPLGDFSGRASVAPGGKAAGPFTRLGVPGIPRGQLGDFSGRAVAPQGRVIDVPLVASVLTPRPPDVLQGQIVDFVGAALVYYPLEPAIDQGRAVLPPAATISLTPLEPAIDTTAPFDNFVDLLVPALLSLVTREPGVGGDVATDAPAVVSLTLTALEPSVHMGQTVAPDAASLALVAFDPLVATERLVAFDPPALAMTVIAPRIEQDMPGDTSIDVVPDPFGPLVALAPTIEQGDPPGPLHLRQQIRQAAAQIMRDEVSQAAGRVYESRVYTVDATVGPYVLVYTTSDIVEAASLDNPPIQRRLITLVIEAVAQAADDLDDVLDALVLQIEQAMATPVGMTLNGLAAGSELTGLVFDMQTGSVPLGVARMTYEVTAYSVADTPQTALN